MSKHTRGLRDSPIRHDDHLTEGDANARQLFGTDGHVELRCEAVENLVADDKQTSSELSVFDFRREGQGPRRGCLALCHLLVSELG